MNEYNYNYLGIPGMIPNNGLDFMNIPMQNNNISYNSYNQNNILDNLYDQYKDYKPANLDPKDEKEAMLWSFLQYNFALNDLGLYLDIYPNDKKVVTLYKQYLGVMNDVKNEFEKKYGPLVCSSMYASDNDWKWDNSPWPWEVI